MKMRKIKVRIMYEVLEGREVIELYEFSPLTVLARNPSSAIRKVAEMVTAKI
jgi:hypothetical protein